MVLVKKIVDSENQHIDINTPVYCEELKGSFSEEVERRRKLKFGGKVQVQGIPLIGKKGRTKLLKARMRNGVIHAQEQTQMLDKHDPKVVQSSYQSSNSYEDWVIVNDENQLNQNSSTATTLEFQLTQF